jgi:hypothetical protein
VEGAVDRDQAQHHLVAQGAPAERELDLVAVGRVLPRGRGRRLEREPAVAAQAAVPAQPRGALAGEQRVLGTELGRVEADQLVAREAADDQLIMELRPKALGFLGAGERGYSSTLSRFGPS